MWWNGSSVGLPGYVGDFAKQLLAAQAWINKGGPNMSAWAGPISIIGADTGHVKLIVEAASDGESEVEATDEELGGQGPLVPKVWAQDRMQHVLNKGKWTETPTV